MSIAQVVFDLPLEGPFDYSIPPELQSQVMIGAQVKVLFGTKKRTGIVSGIITHSEFENLKQIKSVVPDQIILDSYQISLGHQVSSYYGCSLGDALFTILRACERQKISTSAIKKSSSSASLYISPSGDYEDILASLIKPIADTQGRVLILVPDQFMASFIQGSLKKYFTKESCVIGMRSSVFRSLKDISLVIMIDEDNSSFKQEQTPMYETREVLLMRSKIESISIVFVSTTPTVEMMYLIEKGEIKKKDLPKEQKTQVLARPQIIDLNNYKIMVKGILSPAVLSAIESNVSKKLKSVLVFNHRGAYAMTRCETCGFVLKCTRCESPVVFSRTKKQYLCRYCSFQLPADTVCPTCKKPSWKSFGLGIEQLQKTLLDKFPLARIETFERDSKDALKDFDILIGTWALLRLKTQTQANSVVFLDIDSELNRLDMRSCFRAWSMVGHLRGMALRQLFIQSRQMDHYCIRALSQDKHEVFYKEDMKIRKELGFSPFAHQVYIYVRGIQTKQVEKVAQEIYEELVNSKPEGVLLQSPQPEVIAHKRGQYHLNILLQGKNVVGMITLIKKVLLNTKRPAKVIVTLNVDP
jgi:primosomal protein N' (replication factor Y)